MPIDWTNYFSRYPADSDLIAQVQSSFVKLWDQPDSHRPIPSVIEARSELAALLAFDQLNGKHPLRPIKTYSAHPPSVELAFTSFSNDRYQDILVHAQGGLGVVALATDIELNRRVALKTIQPKFLHHPEARQRFIREAEITAQLEHLGIVPVYSFSQESSDTPFYAMRMIPGKSLKDAINAWHHASRQPVNRISRSESASGLLGTAAFRELIHRLITAGNTIAYAHHRGVIHRDIKPANIMLGEFG